MLFTYIRVDHTATTMTCYINIDTPFNSFDNLLKNYSIDRGKRFLSFSNLRSAELNERRFQIVEHDKAERFCDADEFMKVLKENNLL